MAARIYTLYAHFQERTGRVVVQKHYDTTKPAEVRVRAENVRQAYALVHEHASREAWAKNGGPGIVSIRN